MKKTLRVCLSFIVLLTLLVATACAPSEPLVIKESDTYIVITASEDQMGISDTTTLVDYMTSLKGDGQLSFEINNGMLTSVNGIDNPSDLSSCWMLYTSDIDNANSAWGTIEYNGHVYGSAIFGAESLIVKDGCLYIWVYQSF